MQEKPEAQVSNLFKTRAWFQQRNTILQTFMLKKDLHNSPPRKTEASLFITSKKERNRNQSLRHLELKQI